MKIYFEDGELCKPEKVPFKYDFRVDAKKGYSDNCNTLESLHEFIPDAVIYTNSLVALSNRYAQNKEESAPDIYIRFGEYMVFTRIDKCTDREIRESHNIMAMYMNGAFIKQEEYLWDVMFGMLDL